jgi:5-methylcytosine-specific restriction endonuclease McrA
MQSVKSFSLNTPSHKHISPKALSNEELLRNTQVLVAEERKLTTSILWHLHEIQTRRLYSEKGFGSLFEYAVQALGYSEAAAGRRIAAMRLLVDVPEIEPALQTGAVTLSTLSTVQSFIQRKNEPVSRQAKKDLVLSLQGKSRRECEKILVALDPMAALPKERERVVSPTQTEIRFVADDELMQKLQKIRELDGHVQSDPSYLELFHRMADLALKKLDPVHKSQKTKADQLEALHEPDAGNSVTPPTEIKRAASPRYIPAAIKREVWKRDHAQCSYQSADGKKCGSRFALQIDHKTPVAWGGASELSNLQLLCREHNRQKAVLQLGSSKMRRYFR